MQRLETEHGVFTSNEVTGKSAQEVYDAWLLNKDLEQEEQITLESLKKENEQLWQTVDFLLKNTGFIPTEEG